jgi:hypothetical protein
MATSTVPMHAVSGTHHIYVYVGSPPKRQTLIVDTGSRIMAFPCDPCKNCGRHTSPTYYSPLESTTDVQLPCDRCHYDMSVRHRFSVNMYLQYVHTCIAAIVPVMSLITRYLPNCLSTSFIVYFYVFYVRFRDGYKHMYVCRNVWRRSVL